MLQSKNIVNRNELYVTIVPLNEQELALTQIQEAKNDRFRRLAEKRVNDLLDKFRLVGNLSDRRNYDYTEDQAKQIIRALESELKDLKSRFQSEESEQQKSFSFKK